MSNKGLPVLKLSGYSQITSNFLQQPRGSVIFFFSFLMKTKILVELLLFYIIRFRVWGEIGYCKVCDVKLAFQQSL